LDINCIARPISSTNNCGDPLAFIKVIHQEKVMGTLDIHSKFCETHFINQQLRGPSIYIQSIARPISTTSFFEVPRLNNQSIAGFISPTKKPVLSITSLKAFLAFFNLFKNIFCDLEDL